MARACVYKRAMKRDFNLVRKGFRVSIVPMEPHAAQSVAASSSHTLIAAAPAQFPPSYQTPAVGQPSAAMPAGVYPPPITLGYQPLHQLQLQQFWISQMQEIEHVNDFRNHQLPLARIKKIMKADEDVRMISAEAPVVFSKACELFILELTLRSWMNTEENKRRTLQKNDIASAITRTDILDFLVDIVPRDENKDEGVGMPCTGLPPGPSADPMQYGGMYYMQQAPLATGGVGQPTQGMMGSPGVIVGRPTAPMEGAIYMSQQKPISYKGQQQLMQPVWQPPHNLDMPADDPPKASP